MLPPLAAQLLLQQPDKTGLGRCRNEVRLANCTIRTQAFRMTRAHVFLAVSALLATSLTLAACESERESQVPAPSGPPSALSWEKPGVSDSQRQADFESCSESARATIERDVRMDSDRDAGRGEQTGGMGDVGLRQRMQRFRQGGQETRLINDCMTRKGYQPTR